MHCINFRGEIFKITSMLSYSGCYIQTFWKSEASEDSVWILQICRLPLNWWIINQLSIIDNCWKLHSLIFMYAIPGYMLFLHNGSRKSLYSCTYVVNYQKWIFLISNDNLYVPFKNTVKIYDKHDKANVELFMTTSFHRRSVKKNSWIV